MPINIKYPIPAEAVLASFSFTDLVAGLGYETFFPKTSEDSTGVGNFLSPIGSALESTGGQTETAVTVQTTINWDTSTFNLPRTVKGTAYVVSRIQSSTSTGVNTYSVQLLKVLPDDSTVDLSSEVTSQDIDAVTENFTIQLPLTQTIIKKGEKIRLAMILLKGDGGAVFTYSHDGKTESPVFIPFRIDL